eukprot:10591276-Alexandrium_andersonii.AAC.1
MGYGACGQNRSKDARVKHRQYKQTNDARNLTPIEGHKRSLRAMFMRLHRCAKVWHGGSPNAIQ